ncbi:MAG: aminomethyl-transferring glycine dehydrogenase subunit GcvPA [Mariprofundaceae bacterium]|nr:aminomethyl-transferring glycine dehydrogenase subunit GcvPA [Mariprofundaceae bacterium]
MRFLPHTDADRHAMLESMGVGGIRQLFTDIPESFHLQPGQLDLPPALSEADIIRKFTIAAEANRHAGNTRCFLGGGTYHHFVPSVVDYVISRGEVLTAYTPYQPEIAQGTLQTLFEFQTMVARLLGMEVANASMYDAATSVAEAALMAKRITRKSRMLMAASVNPNYRAVTRNYLAQQDIELSEVAGAGFSTDVPALVAAVDDSTAAVIVQYPDFYGSLYDLAPLRAACDAHKALLVVCFSDASAFGLLEAPGTYGADIVCGSGQSLGIPMGFGGPHIGLFACRQKHVRQMPGRLCGMSNDADGRRGFVLTLSTREQHIRREKATSNICSNQGLMCTANACYMTLMGDAGLKQVARRSAAALQTLLEALPEGVSAATGPHYNETVLGFADRERRDAFLVAAREQDMFAGIPLEKMDAAQDDKHLLVATTEMIGEQDVADYIRTLEASL